MTTIIDQKSIDLNTFEAKQELKNILEKYISTSCIIGLFLGFILTALLGNTLGFIIICGLTYLTLKDKK